jgi:hypothetical protein
MRKTVSPGCRLICKLCGTLIYDRGRELDERLIYLLNACEHLIGVIAETDDFGSGYLDIHEDEAGSRRVCIEYEAEEHGGYYCDCALRDLDDPGQAVYSMHLWSGGLHVIMSDDVLEVIEDHERPGPQAVPPPGTHQTK